MTGNIKWVFWIARMSGLVTDDGERFVLTERGAFWIHLLQNHYVLNYIDKDEIGAGFIQIARFGPWLRHLPGS